MSGKEHIVLGVGSGITAGLCLLGNGTVETTGFATFAVLGVLGAMFPDIDEPDSYMGQCFPLFSKLFSKLFGHRQLFHLVPLWLALGLVAYLRGSIYGLAFLLGVYGHLLLDSFTKSGVPLIVTFGKKEHGAFVNYLKHFSFIPFKKIRCKGGTAYSWLITWIITFVTITRIYVFLGGF